MQNARDSGKEYRITSDYTDITDCCTCRIRKRGGNRWGIIEEAESGGDFLICAANETGEIVGFIWAERGKLKRVRHSAYVVTGIRSAYRRQGIGTELFLRLDDWAKKNGIIRLELTVECPNTAAKRLYEKSGFAVEGIKRKTMKVNGSYVDEYCMGKIIG